MTNSQRDLLVAAPKAWDEACFAVPAVRALLASGLGVGVICYEPQRAFWESVPQLDVIACPLKAKPRAMAAMVGDGWQAALVWEDGYFAEAFQRARIPRRLGPMLAKLAKRLTHPLSGSENPLEHRVRFYLSVVEEMGVHTLNPVFFMPAVLGVSQSDHSLLLVPDSDFGASHEWPLERWIELGNYALGAGYSVTVAHGFGKRNRGAALTHALGSAVSVLDVSDLARVLPSLAGQQWVIAADGVLPHLAAHAGAKCITLFGPNDAQWKRPLGKQHRVVRKHVECAPCLLAKCPLDLRCQNELTVDSVIAALTGG